MGMFMASVAFSCNDAQTWKNISPVIENFITDNGDLLSNFQEEGPGYCVVSLYGEMAPYLARLAQSISALTGGYAVFANCVDSDFNMIALWHNGEHLEDSYIGRLYEEYAVYEVPKPDINLWLPLLKDKSRIEEFRHALQEEKLFAEDNLRELSVLTGLPIFDDEFLAQCM